MITPNDIYSLANEEWKPVAGFDGYFISSRGRVLGPKGLRKISVSIHGYGIVHIGQGDRKKTITAHRLVLSTFRPAEDKSLFVDHINGIRLDNRIENLRWVTHAENVRSGRERNNGKNLKLWKQIYPPHPSIYKTSLDYSVEAHQVKSEELVRIDRLRDLIEKAKAERNEWMLKCKYIEADVQYWKMQAEANEKRLLPKGK